MSQITTQKLEKETLRRLKKHGMMGDSFDDVLNRLLDDAEELEAEPEEDGEDV